MSRKQSKQTVSFSTKAFALTEEADVNFLLLKQTLSEAQREEWKQKIDLDPLLALRNASASAKSDAPLALYGIKKEARNIAHANKSLFSDIYFIKSSLATNPESIKFLPADILQTTLSNFKLLAEITELNLSFVFELKKLRPDIIENNQFRKELSEHAPQALKIL